MGKIDLIRSEMMAAMKAKDKERKNVLSALLTELKNFQINKMAELTEEDEDHVVLKLIKQSKETLEMTPADRQDIIDECNYTIKVLEEYAPKMMDEDEITEVIKSVLGELSIETPAVSDKGKIMKVLMPRVKGKADGSLVNQVLGSMLK
ncbi:MAG: GatB/YqeY domain-containing protein [Lachnospiraceae bacterium]|nr:GatB/YqeY domain-containing protein [Lachnospiraceae bacterium]